MSASLNPERNTENNPENNSRIRVKKKSQIKIIWHRFRRNRLAMFGIIVLVIMALTAIFADVFFDYEADALAMNFTDRRLSPGSPGHPLGTDDSGRDMLARIVFGGRISLSVGLVSILISLTFGTFIGASAGYYGGKVDNIIMRIMDVFLAIPQTLMAISIVAALGNSIPNLLIAMSISSIPRFARILRSSVLSIKGQEYVEAARAYGTGDFRIIFKHIMPNAIGPIIVQATLNMASTIIAISGLSFIGLGVPPPTPEWGSMLNEGRAQMRYYPHLVIVPGIAIIFAVMGLNLVGDGLRDALDPRLKN